jgi:hypothetical protein
LSWYARKKIINYKIGEPLDLIKAFRRMRVPDRADVHAGAFSGKDPHRNVLEHQAVLRRDAQPSGRKTVDSRVRLARAGIVTGHDRPEAVAYIVMRKDCLDELQMVAGGDVAGTTETIGGLIVTKRFALIVRDNFTDNGGWL